MRGFEVARACAELIEPRQHRCAFLPTEDSAWGICGALIGVLNQHNFSDQITASVMHYSMVPAVRMGGCSLRSLRAFERCQ
jgi:hypothetical protein